ncbi:MAG TPA: flagellar hook-associated protein FlgK [Fimbriimonadaceae bacterium]|nr:flagellar hook-associated protein FlgK [Fimbriimonadaceae bacterium]
MNSFTGITQASQALQAFQDALSTTGNNISNANTAGYSRETVTFGQNPETTIYSPNGPQYVGTGVNVASINRMRNMFLTAQSFSSASSIGQTNAQLAGGQQIQALFTDAGGTGISNDLTAFYNSWSSLASQPNNANLQAVQQAGSSLAGDVRNTYANLQQLSTQANGQIAQTMQQIQALGNQIAQLNSQIRTQSSGGGQPNGLLDQRDAAVQQLSSLVNVSTQTLADGTMSVNVNQFDLVDRTGAHTFPTTFNAATGTVTANGDTYNITGGQLAGNFATLNSITGAQGNLDLLANNLRTQVNSLMSTGKTVNGTTNQNFFNTSAGAIAFDLDPAVLADFKNIATGVSGNTGDTALALQIADTATQPVAALGNQTTGNFYNSMVTGVGQQVASATSTLSTQQAVATQIQNQIQSISGVSVDEEMSHMVQYQRSYQAAAETLNIVNSTLTDLMNILH